MLTLNENKLNKTSKVSIRYDYRTKTYYLFYYQANDLSCELIFSYDREQKKWMVDTTEHKILFEEDLQNLFYKKKLSFEEQVRTITDYLNTFFSKLKKKLCNKTTIHFFV